MAIQLCPVDTANVHPRNTTGSGGRPPVRTFYPTEMTTKRREGTSIPSAA